jgi:hypothetical protein
MKGRASGGSALIAEFGYGGGWWMGQWGRVEAIDAIRLRL